MKAPSSRSFSISSFFKAINTSLSRRRYDPPLFGSLSIAKSNFGIWPPVLLAPAQEAFQVDPHAGEEWHWLLAGCTTYALDFNERTRRRRAGWTRRAESFAAAT